MSYYDVKYTSCSVNSVPWSANWGKNNLICFSSCRSVRIFDPVMGRIVYTLCGHSKHVNSVRWIIGKLLVTELLSTSTDGTAIVWSYIGDDFIPKSITIEDCNIILAEGCYRNAFTEECVIITSSSNNSLKIYHRIFIQGEITLKQVVSFATNVLSAKFTRLQLLEAMLIGLGMHSGSIILLVEDERGMFFKCAEIEAHAASICCIDFAFVEMDIIFATASYDTKVKIWRIQAYENDEVISLRHDPEHEIVTFQICGVKFVITLDATLHGHNSWIYSVHFNPLRQELLSASMDKTIIVWKYFEKDNVWAEIVRLGDMKDGNVGYLGAMFGPEGHILAHAYFGTFHLFMYSNQVMKWLPAAILGGHTKAVVGLKWDPDGEFIFTTSFDKTTRIHAPCQKNLLNITWHEIGRPQVDEYGMNCIALISRYEFAAFAAEEKIIKVFKAPQMFVQKFMPTGNPQGALLENFRQMSLIPHENLLHSGGENALQGPSVQLTPTTVNRGLINHGENILVGAVFLKCDPPTEDLLQDTLWDNSHRLFALEYQLFSMATTSNGTILACAYGTLSKKYASILLWNTSTWTTLYVLQIEHTTVSQLSFSSDSQHLLTVSECDFTLFTLNNAGIYTITSTNCINTSTISCCAWLPNSTYFATGSADGKVIIWKPTPNYNLNEIKGSYYSAGEGLDVNGTAITAIAVASFYYNNFVFLALGVVTGFIYLYFWNEKVKDNAWQLHCVINQRDAHHKPVLQLAFRNTMGRAGCNDNYNNIIQLASSGSDCAVRVYDIKLGEI